MKHPRNEKQRFGARYSNCFSANSTPHVRQFMPSYLSIGSAPVTIVQGQAIGMPPRTSADSSEDAQ